MKQIIIRPEAEADLEEAHDWYEQKRNGLGAEFLLCVEQTIDSISRWPEASPLVYRNLRRALVRRFPYGVFYFVEHERIIVVGVIHGSRSPGQWKRRLP